MKAYFWRALRCAIVLALAACGARDAAAPGSAAPAATKLSAEVSVVLPSAPMPPAVPLNVPLLAGAIGEQRIAVILVSLPGRPLLSSISADDVRQTFFGATDSVDSWLRAASYGKAWATGEVYSVTLDAAYGDQPIQARDAAVRAVSATASLAGVKRVVMVVPSRTVMLRPCGMGMLAADSVALSSGGAIVATAAWLNDVSMASRPVFLQAAIHELGHNFGLEHARAADFGDEPLGPAGQLPRIGQPTVLPGIGQLTDWDETHEYGDIYSVMGHGLGHFNAAHKTALGWLADGSGVQGAASAGSVLLKAFEDKGEGLKGLRVRRGETDSWLWLEYRKAGATPFEPSWPARTDGGVLVHVEDPSWQQTPTFTYLLRMQADSSNLFYSNAPLTAGMSWRDPYSSLSLRVERIDANGAQVSIDYAAAPTISIAPARTSVAANGASVKLDVTAAAGTAWSASVSAAWLGFTGPASGNGNGKLTLNAAPNTSTQTRWAKVSIGNAFAVVTQAGSAGDLSLSQTMMSFAAEGGSGAIEIRASSPDYSWPYVNPDDWVHDIGFSEFNWKGSGTLRFAVAQNTGAQPRSSTFTIGGKTLTILQAGGAALISGLKWQAQALADAPISRLGFAMAVPDDGTPALLFSGGFDTTSFNDTWRWDGNAWTRLSTPVAPAARYDSSMVYDSARRQFILFGGSNASGELADMWAFDANGWRELKPATKPPARSGAAMTYNPVSGKTLLFGGASLNDTWEWDGSRWQQISSSAAPAARQRPAMAWDAARAEIVLFGGANPYSAGGVYFTDTWTYGEAGWVKKSPRTSPQGSWGPALAYHPALGQLVLVGGASSGGTGDLPRFFSYRDETWTWDGEDWTQRFPDKSPEFSWNFGIGYDTNKQAFIAYLGDDLHCADRGPHMYLLKPDSGAVLLSAYRAEVGADGASGSVNVSVSAQVSWRAQGNSWITLTAGDAGSGNGTVRYQVAPNPSDIARSGRLQVGDKVLTIRQAGRSSPHLPLAVLR